MDRNILELNANLLFISPTGYEYDIHRKKSDDKDKNFYLWKDNDNVLIGKVHSPFTEYELFLKDFERLYKRYETKKSGETLC